MDGNGTKRAKEGRGAVSPVLGEMELGLKAKSLLQGLAPKRVEAPQETRTTDGGVERSVSCFTAPMRGKGWGH